MLDKCIKNKMHKWSKWKIASFTLDGKLAEEKNCKRCGATRARKVMIIT